MSKTVLKNVFLRNLWLYLPGLVLCICLMGLFLTGPWVGRIVPLTSRITEPASLNAASAGGEPSRMPPSVKAVTQAALRFGVFSSLKRIEQVATFLTADNRSGVYAQAPQNPPDQRVFSASFELVRPDNATLYASASFFPNNDAVYDTVEYVEMSVEQVETEVFKELKRIGVLHEKIIMLDAGAVKVFLMPAGSGCVVIKKEVL